MIRFDEAVGVAIQACRQALGEAARGATVVRDAMGLVTVVVRGPLTGEQAGAAASALDEALGAYSPGPRAVLLTERDLIEPAEVFEANDRVGIEGSDAWLVDRAPTNQDWLRAPCWNSSPLPLVAGFSVKGGVGRTTALGVLAWHLAREGRHVVLLDLDLEAPGLGPLLLRERPAYGLVDWLAEDLVGQGDILALDDLLAESPVATGTAGRVQVLPAAGDRTADYVPKLGRVMMPLVQPDGASEGLAQRLARLIIRLRDELGPEAVLIDARAGLHDLGAAAVTQLGAEVLLFVRDERPGWEAWEHLFDHLKDARGVRFGGPEDDLRWRLKMVGAQAGSREVDERLLVDRSFELWTRLYDEAGAEPSGSDPQPLSFERDDPQAPHYPWKILFDPRMRGVTLSDGSERPSWDVIEASFGWFLRAATSRLFGTGEEG